MNNLLSIDKNIVKEIAELLINIKGETTTKDVKNELRNNNYYAIQKDVSQLLAEISEENNWTFTFNGEYRSYFIDKDLDETEEEEEDFENEDDTVILTSVNVTNSVSDITHAPYVNQFHVMKDGFIVKPIEPTTSISVGTWKVFNPTNETQYVYLDGSLSREQVRYAYYKIYGLEKGSVYSAHKI